MNVEKLVEVRRGGMVESIHRGALVVVNARGSVLKSIGDPQYLTYWRSAAKPIQAVPVVESGAAARFGFTDQELALTTASHSGEEEHVRVIRSMLRKMKLQEEALYCGVHSPFDKKTARKLTEEGKLPTAVHSNCSGKHAGMLAIGIHLDYPLSGYHRPEHPVQKLVLKAIARYTGIREQEVKVGIDGCGVPVFGLPLFNMALAYARFAAPDRDRATDRILRAMVDNPFMVAGSDRICTDLMKVAKGTIVAKTGAEGVYCAALVDQGIGIGLKIEDGAQRALAPVIVEALIQLGWLSAEQGEELVNHHSVPLRNFHKEVIGSIRPAFRLN